VSQGTGNTSTYLDLPRLTSTSLGNTLGNTLGVSQGTGNSINIIIVVSRLSLVK